MSRREEKRRRFHDALLNTLYPAASPPSTTPQSTDVITSSQEFDVNLIIADDYGVEETSDDNGAGGSELEQQTVTRAKRKRLRKKKLKEEICRRGGIIGPLLPSSRKGDLDGSSGAVKEDSPSVRRNGDENRQCKKVKQRRMAKRLGREKVMDAEKCVQHQSLESANVENCDEEDKKIPPG